MESWKEELYHHGIDGQKWGVRNGPPYPLDYSSNSAKQKKLNSKSELSKYADKESKIRTSSKKSSGSGTASKILKGVGIAAGITALAASAYIVAKYYTVGAETKNLVSDIISETVNKVVADTKIDTKMLASINKDAQGTINCTQTTTSYILNRVLGLKTTAKNLNGVDEISGLQMAGRDPNIYSAIFDGIKKTQLLADTTKAKLKQLESGEAKGLNEINNLIPKGSTGIIHITGHVLNYEKTSSGVLKFIDPQINAIFTPDEAAKAYHFQNVVWNIFDCTNVSLKEGASDVLQYMVNM